MINYEGSVAGPFNEEIPLVETTTEVLGGLDGPSNAAAKKLADNAAYLYEIAKGFEQVLLIDNTGITEVDITDVQIYRNLVALWVSDDVDFTGNLPQAASLRDGTIACIKRTNYDAVTSIKTAMLAAFAGDLFYDSDENSDKIFLYGEEMVVLCSTTSNDIPGWRVLARYGGAFTSANGDKFSLQGGVYDPGAYGTPMMLKDNDGYVSYRGSAECISGTGTTQIVVPSSPEIKPPATVAVNLLKLASGTLSMIKAIVDTAGKVMLTDPAELPSIGDTIFLDTIKYRTR